MPKLPKKTKPSEKEKTTTPPAPKVVKTTSRSTWKKFERDVASLFGTERTPLSGSNSKITASDTIHPDLFVECKLRQKSAVWTLFDDAKEKARKENKTPVVALKRKGSPGFLLVMRPEDIDKIVQNIKTENGNERTKAVESRKDN